MSTLLLAVCCLNPVEARFLLTISGVPMAVLRVEVRDGVYRYESTLFLDEGEERFERAFRLDERGEVDGLSPEVLVLLRPPPSGCRPVLEERRGARETLCVDRSSPDAVGGRLDEVPFSARYEGGQLATIALPGVQWARLEGPPPAGHPSPVFRGGFEVRAAPGPWRLEPALAGARLVTTAVRGTGQLNRVGRRRCLVLAKEAVKGDPALTLVLGLVMESGRAYPHAWVRRGAVDEDPSRLPSDEAAFPDRQYLELPREAAGRAYLELVDGRRWVTGGAVRGGRQP